MLRDESTNFVGSRDSASVDVEAKDSKNSVVGEVVIKILPSADNDVKDPPREGSAGVPATMYDSISEARGSNPSSPNSGSVGRRNSLRRSGSTIASLRAAFEDTDKSETSVKRFEKSPGQRVSDRSDNIPDWSRERDAEVGRLEKLLEKEIGTRVSSQSKLEAQLKVEIERRKRYQERCEMLQKKIEEGQALRTQLPDTAPSRSSGSENDSSADTGTRTMQRQLTELKRNISTATRIENQVSDSTFAQEISKLHHELQNFIVNTFRRAKLVKPEDMGKSLESVATAHHLEYLRPLFSAFEPLMKLALLQAAAVYYVLEIFNEPLLFGLPEQQEWQDNLRQTVKTLPSVLSPSTFNKWRYLTLDAVRQSASIGDSIDIAASRVSVMICDTLSSITDVPDLSAQSSSLTSIVMRAVQLQHLFRVQQAQYEFALPIPGTPFQPDLMEDHIVDDEMRPDGTIKCATFPSVIKYGGETGDNMQQSNIVVKAKVLCRSVADPP